jgi:acyl carrier protein
MSVEEKVQKIVCEQLGVSQEEAKLKASFIVVFCGV